MDSVGLRFRIKDGGPTAMSIVFCRLRRVNQMAFKITLLVALCVAQGFAFQPYAAVRDVACSNTAGEISHDFEEAVNQIDEVRETVSLAAMDAYAKGSNVEIVIACFRAQRGSYEELGQRIAGMIRSSAQALGEEMRNTAEKYAKLMEVPLRTIAETMRTLPERVYNHLKQLEFTKAAEAIKESREIVQENGRLVGELMQKMVGEVPQMADKAEEMAKEIRSEARKGSEAIRKAFGRCVEEGGPKAVSSEE